MVKYKQLLVVDSACTWLSMASIQYTFSNCLHCCSLWWFHTGCAEAQWTGLAYTGSVFIFISFIFIGITKTPTQSFSVQSWRAMKLSLVSQKLCRIKISLHNAFSKSWLAVLDLRWQIRSLYYSIQYRFLNTTHCFCDCSFDISNRCTIIEMFQELFISPCEGQIFWTNVCGLKFLIYSS